MDFRVESTGNANMLFVDAGNDRVGIGTNAPTKLLEVSSNAADVTTIKAQYNATNYLEFAHNRINAVNSGGTDFLLLQTAGTNRAIINATGLGIGTTAPAQTLAVLKNANYNPPGLGASAGHFFFGKQDGSGAGSYGLLGGTQGTGNSWLQAQRIDGTANEYAILLQPSGGNVGIGTTNPPAKLSVEWTGSNVSTDNIARITAPVYPSLEFYSTNTTATNRNWKIAGVHNSYGRFEILRSSAANGVANVSTFAIDHNGNFGFGAAPSSDYKVLIDGGIYLNAKSVIGNSGYFICGTNGFRWNNGTDQYNNVIMYDNGNMYVRGHVGIGATPSGTIPLEVVNSGEARIKAKSTNNNWAGLDLESHGSQSNYIFFRDNSAERARIQVTDNEDFIISQGNSPSERLKITSAGPSISNGGSTGSFTYNVIVNKASGANDSSYSGVFSAAHTISSSVSAPMEYFKTVALINTRAYHNYVNIKTNLTSNGIMFLGHFLGYMYGYGKKEAFVGGYTHTNNSLISQYSNTTLQGTGTMSGSAYRASDGAICFKIQLGHTSYTEGQLIFRFHSHSEATTRACTVVAAQVRNDGTNHYA